jgi:hypothetical protein
MKQQPQIPFGDDNPEGQATAKARTNTGILRLRRSQSAVSNFAQDDEGFCWSKKEQATAIATARLQRQQQIPLGDENQKDRQQQKPLQKQLPRQKRR